MPPFLAFRTLREHLARTLLSGLAVALGVAMIVAPSVISSGISTAWTEGESAMAWITDMVGIVFSSIGLVISAAAGFLIFNTFTMAVTQRQREIGMLRSLGMTRRQVMRMILTEALATSLLGTLVGVAGGPFLGRGILHVMERMGVETGRSSLSIPSVLLAVVLGVGVTLLSALPPARRATRTAPIVTLRGPATEGRAGSPSPLLTGIGLLILGGLLTYLVIAPPGEWSGENTPWEWIMTLLMWAVWFTVIGFTLPALTRGLIWSLGIPLRRLLGTPGRLMVDNLHRTPQRVRMTVLTFAVGVMSVVATGGILAFNNDVLLGRLAVRALQQEAFYIYPFDRTDGVAQLSDFDAESLGLEEEVVADVYRVAEGQAHISVSYMLLVPKLGSPLPGFPSLLMDVYPLWQQDGFTFQEGDWEQALPHMEEGCGLLIPPAVAARNNVGLGDPLPIAGQEGPVDCIVAGIGTGGFVPMSIIGLGAAAALLPPDRPPDTLILTPLEDANIQTLVDELRALAERHGDDAWLSMPEDEIDAVFRTSDQLQAIFNGLMLLAVLAAALGLVNTTMMSVMERQREFGLLRAVGATRRQVVTVVIGEGMLAGFAGSLLGTLMGVGMSVTYALSYGGIPFGLIGLPLWQGAAETLLPALQGGAVSFFAAPLLAAAAAYPTIRPLLARSITEMTRNQ